MKKLVDVFNGHTDKITGKWFHYIEIYERHFQKFVGTNVKILEIGVEKGGSLQIWKKYFGDKCQIIGIDILEKSKFEESQIKVEIGSQSDLNFLEKINKKYGPFDIIIDDGSHLQMDVLTSFSFLYPKLKKGGIYFIEDLHTAYLRGYSGGISSPFNFVSIASKYVHDLNTCFMKEAYTSTLDEIKSICFYNSIIVFEKGNDEKIYCTRRGENVDIHNVVYNPETFKQFFC